MNMTDELLRAAMADVVLEWEYDTTADDLAYAVAVLAAEADRAQRHAEFYRTPIKRAWAERATRAHAAVVRLQEAGGERQGCRQATPDVEALMLELADAGVRRLTIECRPSRTRSLYVAVWSQGGRRRSVEGSALPVALRRAVRAARGVSGDVKAKGQVG